MDFTGHGGRVIDDPNEALGVALEEAQHMRVSEHVIDDRNQVNTRRLP